MIEGYTTHRTPILNRRLRLGFVGGGRGLVGHWHSAGARLSNQWNIVAGALSSNPDVAQKSGQEWDLPIDRIYNSYQDMAETESQRSDGIDAVAICTPNDSHFRIAKTFLENDIPVILDKPMTNTVADAQELVELTKVKNGFLTLTYPFVFHAMARHARHMVQNGELGRIRQVNVEYLQEWATLPPDPNIQGRSWRMMPERSGRSSVVADIGTHAYHLLHFVTGLKADEIRADFHVCGAPKDLEDTAYVNLRLEGGVPGLLWVTQAAPGQYCGLRIRVWGEKGGISWDQENPERLIHAPLNEPERHILRGKDTGLCAEAERLVHLPRGHPEALPDAWANLYSEIAIAISARISGQMLPSDFISVPTPADGAHGVQFVNACADSHEAGGSWVSLEDL
ncbi:Gfo/Idh/MocA family oxidoreductase [Shimia sp.]|uniref:Gfo/Idh/MocA family protein n=1 Tax=Shimia sp. TaxID=1954381 RepID=UPI0032968317